MGYLRRLAKKCRDIAKDHVDEPDAPAVADGDGGHADEVKIGLLLLKEDRRAERAYRGTRESQSQSVARWIKPRILDSLGSE
jgi:IS5 family transposase